MKDKDLYTAFQKWGELSSTQEQYLAYESRAKRVLDEEAAVREAELRVQEAEQKAQQKVEEAKQEAEQQAKEAEQQAKEAIARRLLAKGLEIKDVVQTTELDKETVIKIQQDMK